MAEVRLRELRGDRIKKLGKLRRLRIEAYPSHSDRTHTVAGALKAKGEVTVAGRLFSLRRHGGITFADLEDASGKLQLAARQDDLGKDYQLLGLLDPGDFIEARGSIAKTKAGERSLFAKSLRILAKALRPLPQTYFGLKDIEERYRHRAADFAVNREIRELFQTRAEIINRLRAFLQTRGFLEVETPILQNVPGGAIAEPFKTHYNAYDTEVFLRIAPELYLKRLIIGGFEKVFELGTSFRNEGVDATHNPEFTMLEFYWAYADEEDLIRITEEMVEEVASPYRRVRRPFTQVEYQTIAKTDEEFKKATRAIKEPTFVRHHPTEASPLAKKLDESRVRRLQLIWEGVELVNAYAELNDPLEQAQRFRKQGGRQDWDYVADLEYGMPPTAGFGLGVDRLVLLLTGRRAIREVILFPYMRPK